MTFDDSNYSSNTELNDFEYQNSCLAVSEIEVDEDQGQVLLKHFSVENKDLVSAICDLEPVEQAKYLLAVINFGTETMRLTNSTATAESLKGVAESVKSEIENGQEKFVNSLASTMNNFISPESTLGIPALLAKWREEFLSSLLSEFDLANNNGVISKLNEVINQQRNKENSELALRLDFNNEDSAVNVLASKLSEVMRTEVARVDGRFEVLSRELGISKAVDEATTDVPTTRGNNFESDFFNLIQDISRPFGDVADDPGSQRKPGLDGNNEGDITVVVNPEAIHGESALFVYECKLRGQGISDAAALRELDLGISNRGAKAGVIVTQPKVGSTVGETDFFFPQPKNRAILVVDPETPDLNAVRYSYLWLRLQCLETSGKSLSTTAVKGALQQVSQSIGKFTQMKTNNTKAKGLIEANDTLVTQMQGEIKAELDELAVLIAEAEAAGSDE